MAQRVSYGSYIGTGQRGVVRLQSDRTRASIGGLCTDGLFTCVCLALVSSDRRRMALLHTDHKTATGAIIDECRWVLESSGGGTVSWIPGIQRDFFLFGILPWGVVCSQPSLQARVRQALDEAQFAGVQFQRVEPAWAVALSRQGEVTTLHTMPAYVPWLLLPCFWYCAVFVMPWWTSLLCALLVTPVLQGAMGLWWNFRPTPQVVPQAMARLQRNLQLVCMAPDRPERYPGLDLQFNGVAWT
jgi:hypothetical protein